METDAGGALTRRTLAHETVHACLAALGNWPAWVHEGLAQRLQRADNAIVRLTETGAGRNLGALIDRDAPGGTFEGSAKTPVSRFMTMASAGFMKKNGGSRPVKPISLACSS